ncbi:MAG: UDP-N-acetylglucosamine 2-epimerase (non-hydrolyzing) [Candidatus Woesebacteria bacterium]
MIALLVGTRPEIIKMAPVIRELQRKEIPFLFIHSNQHYSEEMDGLILKDLSLPSPDVHLRVGSGSHAVQTGRIMVGVEEACIRYKPEIILVHGDTNTTLSGALAAKKLHIPVAHVEAGLRSFDYAMPEEINRILTDRISDLMFAPTKLAQQNLLKEGISKDSIIVTGNTVVDALRDHLPFSKKSMFLTQHKLKPLQYVLVTAHRAENTDNKESFANLLSLLEHAHRKIQKIFLWPLHPRILSLLEKENMKLPSFILTTPPLGYIDMLAAMSNATLVMTDSGGLQEEAYLLKRPLITLRTSTERPETLSANFIIGTDQNKFDEAWSAYILKKVSWSDELGSGMAASKIVSSLQQFLKDKQPMKKKEKSVSVLGLGYIGLPTALLIAEQEIEVYGFDISKEKRDVLRKGVLPFQENGLPELFSRVQLKNTFHITDTVESSEYYLISVPTPQIHGKADLKYVRAAINSIKPVFQPNQTIIVESTIGPRDCVDELIPLIRAWKIPFHFAHCPERAIPGNTLWEMVKNDRIIGGDTPESSQTVADLYALFVKGPIHQTNTIIAASCKVMENTYRAVNIALANEFSQLAQELDFDVWEAITLANKHPRVQIHQPGPGVGGHCIPIDPWFFVGGSSNATVIEAALKKNKVMPKYIAKEISKMISKRKIEKPIIALLGYAYKKNVDDYRETPAQPLFEILEKKYKTYVTDPFVKIKLITGQEQALRKANIWVVVTDHDQYKEIDLSNFPNLRLIYDTRNCFTKKQLESFRGTYRALGQNKI